ncbi:unnamed protein product [Angiostrongylus costaricensis]|uniref:AA_permease_C domain-containing protein n=1 Tax=Angiostrongylus costaricensis TaxID=334426 RepID=A0A0R3PUE1_ANGCS|nr:unnamed protein product [Angiostrongylus costaricensis]
MNCMSRKAVLYTESFHISEMSSAVAYYVSFGLSGSLTVASFVFICGHEQNSLELSFRVPLVPFIPSLGLLINVFMMSYLDYLTWIRFIVWMSIGISKATIIKYAIAERSVLQIVRKRPAMHIAPRQPISSSLGVDKLVPHLSERITALARYIGTPQVIVKTGAFNHLQRINTESVILFLSKKPCFQASQFISSMASAIVRRGRR